MITTYEYYSRQKDRKNVIDRGIVNDNGKKYFCYDLIEEQQTNHYLIKERDKDLQRVKDIFTK